jgi:hypothetical protein
MPGPGRFLQGLVEQELLLSNGVHSARDRLRGNLEGIRELTVDPRLELAELLDRERVEKVFPAADVERVRLRRER